MPAWIAPTGSKPSPTPQITGAGPRLYRVRTKLVEPAPTFTFDDSASGTIILAGSFTQSFTHFGSRTATITTVGVVPNESNVHTASSDYQDHTSIEATLTGTRTQSYIHTSNGLGTIIVVPAWGAFPGAFYPGQIYPGEVHGSTETGAHSGTGFGTITTSGTAISAVVYTDSRTSSLTLTGSSTQSAVHSSSRTITVTLSGASIESYIAGGVNTFNDVRAGTVTLTTTRTEAAAHTSSRTGTVRLTGTGSDPDLDPIQRVDDMAAVLVCF